MTSQISGTKVVQTLCPPRETNLALIYISGTRGLARQEVGLLSLLALLVHTDKY